MKESKSKKTLIVAYLIGTLPFVYILTIESIIFGLLNQSVHTPENEQLTWLNHALPYALTVGFIWGVPGVWSRQDKSNSLFGNAFIMLGICILGIFSLNWQLKWLVWELSNQGSSTWIVLAFLLGIIATSIITVLMGKYIWNKLVGILVCFSLLLVNACNDSSIQQSSEDSAQAYKILKPDTIPEPNSPTQLDLSIHQLFLDTSRNSQFFKDFENYTINERRILSINEELQTINSYEKSQRIDFKQFPKRFLEVKKLDGHFVHYNPCDGSSPLYELRDSAFIYHGVHEASCASFIEVLELEKDRFYVKMRDYSTTNTGKYRFMKIVKTEIPYVYKFNNGDTFQFLIPLENITQFDMLVNHCPTMKMIEYRGFDEFSDTIHKKY